MGLTPGSGRSLGEGNDNPLQYSCQENSMDREAWWASVHGVAKSWTQLITVFVSYLYCMCSAYFLSHVRLFATPWTVACQAALSMRILQARILEWVAMHSSRGSSQPRSPALQMDSLPAELPGKPTAHLCHLLTE